jgi:hypothetical protein
MQESGFNTTCSTAWYRTTINEIDQSHDSICQLQTVDQMVPSRADFATLTTFDKLLDNNNSRLDCNIPWNGRHDAKKRVGRLGFTATSAEWERTISYDRISQASLHQ